MIFKFYHNYCCPFKNCFSIAKTKFSQMGLFVKPTVVKCEHPKELCKVILTGEMTATEN